jgi:hypothetical protein
MYDNIVVGNEEAVFENPILETTITLKIGWGRLGCRKKIRTGSNPPR